MAHFTLTIALSHVVAFLTSPLANSVASQTVERLRASLEANLVKEFENNWFPAEPQRGSEARALSLSPNRLPPRPLLASAFAARLPWSQWIQALGGKEFDLFVDPGSVSVRKAGSTQHHVIWAASAQAPRIVRPLADSDIDDVLKLINNREVNPSWMSPLLHQFPKVPQPKASTLRVDAAFLQSRCASRLSNVSDAESESSLCGPPSLVESDSLSSVSSLDTDMSRSRSKASSGVYVPPARRGLSSRFSSSSSSSDESESSFRSSPRSAKDTRVLVDTTKVDPTIYDAGKTAVLTGGVMLGMGTPAKRRPLLC
ncbi:hypothetical protein AURDEDRAFT_109778 [Auricularia subglabra TFB-10046 SS5]|nr:hypothetical protein AURDEDRAFT_109778 [Auricularia subglabra TFB-10046 SS5]